VAANLSAMFARMWARISGFAQENKALTTVGVITSRYCISDIMVQTLQKDDPSSTIDWRRTMTMTSFGFTWSVTSAHLMYVKVYPWMFSVLPKMGSQPKHLVTIAVDMLIHMQCYYYPAFYCSQEFMSDMRTGTFRPAGDMVSTAWGNYTTNFVEDLTNMCAMWVPLHLINFNFVPLHFRTPFIAGMGFLWAARLSFLRGAATTDSEDKKAE